MEVPAQNNSSSNSTNNNTSGEADIQQQSVEPQNGICHDWTTLPGGANGHGDDVAREALLDGHNTAATVIQTKGESTNGRLHNGELVLAAPQSVAGAMELMPMASSQAILGEGVEEDPLAEDSVSCGLGVFTIPWLQCLACKQAFLLVFCLTCVLQGMYYTYFVSVITTIEKLFQIKSKTTGIIMSATEIGQIGSSLLLTYYGGQGHRPRWIGWGMVLFAISSFTCSMPHFLYGKDLAPRAEYGGDGEGRDHLCYNNETFGNNTSQVCTEDVSQGGVVKTTTVVLSVFFVSLLGVGMGQTAVYTLGIPYIDDNVANRESPLYFAVTIGVRILGPMMGFVLGSVCTAMYVDLDDKVGFTAEDPRWIGAWWLGLVIISSLLIVVSLAMFAFPSRLPQSENQPTQAQIAARMKKRHPSLKDFPKAVKRLLGNQVLMLRTASSVLHILPIAGLYTFLPKYLESQFRMTAHKANMISGVGGILVMGVGILASGVFIRKAKPNARFVAAWIALTALVYSIGMALLMFVGCPLDDFAGLVDTPQGRTIVPPCNVSCACTSDQFAPVCGTDGMSYFSACHAGCHNVSKNASNALNFSSCECIGEEETATVGLCQLECDNFTLYLALFSIFVLIHSTSEVGSMLLILRCVEPTDKAMALGLIQFAIGLFGNVPCPIIYGAVVDSACLVWKTRCNEIGACGLYDSGVFRMFFHGTTGAIMLCAFFMDLTVWYKAGSISFTDEEPPPPVEESNQPQCQLQYETNI